MDAEFNYKRIFLLGFGFFGISIIWALYNAYVPIFLQEDFGLNKAITGGIMTIDNIFAIVLLPYLGALSDMTRTRWGRRKPYIMIGAPLGALMFALIPVARAHETLALMMGTIIFMNFFMALFRSPVIAFMPDITPSEKRSQANGIINFMGGLGALFAYFGGKILYDINYALPFYVGAAIMLLANIFVVLFVPEPERYKKPAEKRVKLRQLLKQTSRVSFGELKENLQDVFASRERSLLFMLLAIFLWFVAFNSLETFFTSYAKFQLGIRESTGAFLLGIFALGYMVFSIPGGLIGGRIGRKKTISMGLVTIIGVMMITLYLGLQAASGRIAVNTVVKIFSGLFLIGGFGWGMVNVNSLPMVVDMTTEEKLGGYTGLYYFFSQAASIFAPPVVGAAIDVTGYQSLLVFSALFFVLALISLQFVRRGDIIRHSRDVPDMG
ncbi:SLC45 family MFS transporter [Thermococcus atlanticus]